MPLPPDPATLELSIDEMQRLGALTVQRVAEHIASLGSQPAVGDVDAQEFCRRMRETVPEEGVAYETLLDALLQDYVPRSFTSSGPGYLAYIPGGGLYTAALADFIAAGTNRFTGIWLAAPALVQLEANTLEWLRQWMGLPDTARGLYTSGGSMANFSAIACARERLLGDDIRRGVLYTSDQVHHSVTKAARIAGIRADHVRALRHDAAFRLRVDALESAVAEDRARGLMPFMVVSSAGTTNTGAVDPLDAISDLSAREGLWHHVDGAYGACFHIVPELQPLLAGLSRVDSITLDPHKGLFLPYGTGALLVRDGAALRELYTATAGYLPGGPDPVEFYDPSHYSPDLTRGFPGLRLWLTLKLFGARRIRAAIAEKRALALDAYHRIRAMPGIVIDAPPELSLFAFHVTWPGATLADENQATEHLLDGVKARRRVLLSGCVVDGRFLARICVLSFRTRQDRIDACVEDVQAALADELSARGQTVGAGG